MSTNRPIRALIALVAALLIWSVLSYALISMFSGSGVCSILQTVGPGSTTHQLTQAEMDAQVAARCNRPNLGTLVVSGAGYILIVGVAAGQWLSRPKQGGPNGP